MNTQMKDLIKRLYFEEYLEYKSAEKIFRAEKIVTPIKKNHYLMHKRDLYCYRVFGSPVSESIKELEGKTRRVLQIGAPRRVNLDDKEFYEIPIEIIEILPFDTVYRRVFRKLRLTAFYRNNLNDFLYISGKGQIEFIKMQLKG